MRKKADKRQVKELLTYIIGYPVCILSLAAVPYGVYALLVYRYEYTGFLKYVAIGIAAVCAVAAFCVFLGAQEQTETERQNRELRREKDRFERLYWEYVSKYKKANKEIEKIREQLADANHSTEETDVSWEAWCKTAQAVAEANRQAKARGENTHIDIDFDPAVEHYMKNKENGRE